MNDFEKTVDAFIRHHGLLTKDRPVGVALSGGADSVALLTVLVALGYECVALHCNFHLRGEESDRDCRAAMDCAERLGAKCLTTDVDVAARMKRTGESVEMACRELRYEWFSTLYAHLGLQAVAVAHHSDDRAETYVLNALRGTGLRGLVSMRPRRDYVVRPLLCVGREAIEKYLRETDTGYVTDSSNLTDDYQRNRVRHHVLPSARLVRADAVERLNDTISRLDDARQLYEHMLDNYRKRFVAADGSIALSEIIAEGDTARILLYEILAPYGINMSQTEQIIASAAESGRRFGQFTLDRGRLLPVADDCAVKPSITMTRMRPEDFAPHRDPRRAYFDASVLEGNPEWNLRPWRTGDRFRPFGMKGTRLVSDLLSDARLSIAAKRNVWVLTRNSEILWVVGMRAGSSFPVSESTAEVIELSI